LKLYVSREKTRLEHQWDIAELFGFTDFATAESGLVGWLEAEAWTTGAGPRALFTGAVDWLRARRVLLPGVTTLADLVVTVRQRQLDRLHRHLAGLVSVEQADLLDLLLVVPADGRRSVLDGWRRGERSSTGKGMVAALDRVTSITAVGIGTLDIGAIPKRRLIELARYGIAAKAPKLARHPRDRRIATLVATVYWLEITAIDDALELFDVFMANDLISKATKAAERQTLRRQASYMTDAGILNTAVKVLFQAASWGDNVTLDRVWAAIDTAVGSRDRLRDATNRVTASAPPIGATLTGRWRETVVDRYATVSGFVKLLCQVIEFEATAETRKVLVAMTELAGLLDTRPSERVPRGYLDVRKIHSDIVPAGWWQKLVFPSDRPAGTVDRNAYVFCVLELFHTGLRRREIFASRSDRWADPTARLLQGQRWEQARTTVLNALQLPEQPDMLLASHSSDLDIAWHNTAGGISSQGHVTVDDNGRLHVGIDHAVEEPVELRELRGLVASMLPEVDLSELILEIMIEYPAFTAAFSSLSGARSRLNDLHVSIAGLLTSHALNVGFGPVTAASVEALTGERLAHVDQHYLRPETYAKANAVLIDAQSEIGLARLWGGGHVAAVDGMRFVVPIRTIDARPNPKYFGRKRGVTWLNMISDRAIGLTGKVISGTPKDTLHVIDLVYNPDGGPTPDVVITDQGSYSDVVFGILTLLGFDYRPVLADLPDTKLWRIDPTANYGPLNKTARGRIDIDKIDRYWPDILRVVASVHTREISAHDVIRVLQHDGRLTGLGDAIANYGRIFKTIHVLTFVQDPAYRRQLKHMRNLQEGRHGLGRHFFHGRKGELYEAYHAGMEDQLGALGLVLNCATLWNTIYIDHIIRTLRAAGHAISDAHAARLSAYQYRHVNVLGHYSFATPDHPGIRRELRPTSQPIKPTEIP
jgi:TnpA family transposase